MTKKSGLSEFPVTDWHPTRELVGDETEERVLGLISAGITVPPSPWSKFKDLLQAPFRFLAAAFSWITWHVYGKRRFEKRVQVGLARWRRNAGISGEATRTSISRDIAYERVQMLLDEKPASIEAAKMIHDDIIKTRIVRPPAPDVDDTGLGKTPIHL